VTDAAEKALSYLTYHAKKWNEGSSSTADLANAATEYAAAGAPIPMRLVCPDCRALHIDEGEFATKVHHTHACQQCGAVWRPAVVATVGVRFLPGFRNQYP
jgi:rubredoxin